MKRLSLVLACIVGTLLPSTLLAAPPLPELGPEQDEDLSRGRVALRDLDPGADIPHVLGVVDIAAPPETVWAALLDFEARVPENGPLKAVETYRSYQAGGMQHTHTRWELRILGQDIIFHNHYQQPLGELYLSFGLDPERESDLVSSFGQYFVVPSPVLEGGTRWYYIARSNSGRNIPRSIRNWLSRDSLRTQLKAIKERAERIARSGSSG